MVAKWVDRDQASPGETLRYTLVVMNDQLGGQDPGTYVRILDRLPETLEYVPGSLCEGARYDAANRSILWDGQVPRGLSVEVNFTARLTPAAGGMRSVTNTVLVTDAFGRETEGSAQTQMLYSPATEEPRSAWWLAIPAVWKGH
jgi:uncharacterized repeat protein (TIGR01451 family)